MNYPGAKELLDQEWTIALTQLAPAEDQQRYFVERLRAVADGIEKIPAEVFMKFWQHEHKRTGGVMGKPLSMNEREGTVADFGWRAIWSVFPRGE